MWHFFRTSLTPPPPSLNVRCYFLKWLFFKTDRLWNELERKWLLMPSLALKHDILLSNELKSEFQKVYMTLCLTSPGPSPMSVPYYLNGPLELQTKDISNIIISWLHLDEFLFTIQFKTLLVSQPHIFAHISRMNVSLYHHQNIWEITKMIIISVISLRGHSNNTWHSRGVQQSVTWTSFAF